MIVQGSDALFDQELIDAVNKTFLNRMFWWREGYVYASNWRNLHVDGLEGRIFSRDLPVSKGGQIQFFNYREIKADEPIV